VSFISPDLVSDDVFTAFFWLTYVNSTINPFLGCALAPSGEYYGLVCATAAIRAGHQPVPVRVQLAGPTQRRRQDAEMSMFVILTAIDRPPAGLWAALPELQQPTDRLMD